MTYRSCRPTALLTSTLFALLLALPAGAAETFEIDAAHSSVGFRVRHLVSYVNGTFNRFTGSITLDEKDWSKSKVSATIEAASIDTNNEKRDAHLRNADFFDTDKFPTLSFTSTKVIPKGMNKLRVLGNLTMHGVTRPVILEATYAGQAPDHMGGRRAGFTATTTVKRKEFGISWNRSLDRGGTMLGEDVQITLEVEAVGKR